MVSKKEEVYRISLDVNDRSLADLQNLLTLLSKIEQSKRRIADGGVSVGTVSSRVSATSAAEKAARGSQRISAGKMPVSSRVSAALAAEKVARDKLDAAVAKYRAGVKSTEKVAVAAARNIERAVKADEVATRRAAKEAERAAKAANRAREQFKKAFLSIGKNSAFGFGAMVRNAAGAAIALVGLHKVLQKIGEAKDRYLRFDELTSAAMVIAHAGDQAYEQGARGAEQYKDALRVAADEIKVTSSEMADSALFWVKAGQTNTQTIVELSKVGTMFARANRDAANNVLDQARANDILSDALDLFRKDTSTTEKAMDAATKLGDQMTAAANAGNIVVEQLFEYSKKVAGLFKTGEVADEQIMAIATSLASAGLKEESGVHVRRILTQLANGSVQKLLRKSGIEVSDEQGSIRSFGDIFGELQEVLKTQKPLERMKYLKDLFGQRAVSTAAAMAGLNEEGKPGTSSINEIVKKIQEADGLAKRNQEEYLKTTAGRVQALTSGWSNALDKVLEDSGIIQKVLSGLEKISPVEIFRWMETSVIPALESFGATIRDTVIPGIQMAAANLSDWFSPALSVFGSLLGGTASSAEGFASTITTLVKLWVKWRIALLAIKGLRMIDWFADFAKKAAAAATATKAIGTTTTKSVGAAKTAVGGLAGAFSVAGIAVTAAIAAWGIFDAIVGPIIDAERRIEEFKTKYGKGFERLKVGDEEYDTLEGRIKDLQIELKEVSGARHAAMSKGVYVEETPTEKRLNAELEKLRSVQSSQVKKEFGVGRKTEAGLGRYFGGQSTQAAEGDDWDTQTAGNLDKLWLDFYNAVQSKDAELLETAQEAYENALNKQLASYQDERSALEAERDETYEKFVQAQGEERAALNKQLGFVADRLKENADVIGEYTKDLDVIAGEMSAGEEAERFSAVEEAAEKELEGKRGRAFRGGKTEALNPFATPLMSGLDPAGNRMVNLALQGNAAEYYKKSPEARETLARQLKAENKNIVNVNFGDASITVTAKSNAKPEEIAKAVKNEWWKIGERQRHDVERVIGMTVPGEI